MSQAVPDVQNEFWRPPSTRPGVVVSPTIEACTGCGSEYMVGARFCYLCGLARERETESGKGRVQFLALLRGFAAEGIKLGLGLGTVSMVAFLTGLACIVVALLRGTIHSAHNLEELELLQLSRLQWLLGSVASFVAAMLLNRAPSGDAK